MSVTKALKMQDMKLLEKKSRRVKLQGNVPVQHCTCEGRPGTTEFGAVMI